MKKSRNILIILSFALLMFNCSLIIPIPKSIENSFTYCFDGKYTGIDTLINIHGFYKETVIYNASLKDTSHQYFMFYDNGIFVWNIRDSYYDEKRKKNVIKDVELFLKDFAENSETSCAKSFYLYFWGGYIICGDTIKMQKMSQGLSLNSGWHLREEWYKVIDKNTLLFINSFNLPITEISQPVIRTNYPIVFCPIQSKPKQDKSWILKEKWFWCNEKDWEKYMEKLKNEKEKKNEKQ